MRAVIAGFCLADGPAETTDFRDQHAQIVMELTALVERLRASGRSRP